MENDLVPQRKYTSLDPDLEWRIDNLRCTCGLCHQFSGTTAKTCWVFGELGCDFSVAARKYFWYMPTQITNPEPIFDPVSRGQQLPLVLKNVALAQRGDRERMQKSTGVLSLV